ncbi:MAG: M48 family metalloprotease [Terrimicrobiaceae bacterium]
MIPESPPDSQRVSFFDEQATHRARAGRWGAVSALLILGLGSVYGFLMLGVISFYALLIAEFLPKWLTAPLAATGLKDHPPPAWFLLAAGMILAAVVAAAIQRVLGTASLGAIERSVGLRPVNAADLEERQLANIVSEMAIAGGVPEPRVLLMEGDVVNAGAAGKEPCTVFVSRRMLDHLDRDETQGVLGHLLASIANGDLRIASGVLTVLQTLGLLMTAMDVPFSARARSALADLARYVFGGKGDGSAVEAHRVAARLTVSLQPEGMNDMLAFMERMLNLPLPLGPFNKVAGSLILMLFMPLILSRLAGFIVYSMLTLFVLGPFIAFTIRSRRRLADATAVQLTRNPDGLARWCISQRSPIPCAELVGRKCFSSSARKPLTIATASGCANGSPQCASNQTPASLREPMPRWKWSVNSKNLPRAGRTNRKSTVLFTDSTLRSTGASASSNEWAQMSHGTTAGIIPISSTQHLWAVFSS